MKSNKGKIVKSFFYYNWWKILAIGAIGCVALVYITKRKTAYKDDEIMHIFAAGKLKDRKFNELFYNSFHAEDKIYQINTTAIEYDSAKYESAYKSIFGIDCDLIIVPESHLKDNDEFKVSVYKFNEEEVNYLTTTYSAEIYKYKNYNIGLKIYDKEDTSYNDKFKVNQYFTYAETSYVFIDKTSTNLKTKGYLDKSVAWNALTYFLAIK